MTIAPKIAIDHFNSARFRVTVSHPEFGMFEQWIDKTSDDDMDGGVTAALIEKEAAVAAQPPSVGLLESALKAALDAERTTIKERDAALARAEEAEKERDRWREYRDGQAHEDERVQAWDRLVNHPAWSPCFPEERPLIDSMMGRLDGLVEAEKAHRQMPDITDEMVERAHRSLISHHGYGRILRSQVREALTAALTEPPARPEGAEELDGHVDASLRGVGLHPLTAEELRTVADNLASEGVRVVGEDGAA